MERNFLRGIVEKKVERVDDRHGGHQLDGNGEFLAWLWKHDTRIKVAKGVLLPIQKVVIP